VWKDDVSRGSKLGEIQPERRTRGGNLQPRKSAVACGLNREGLSEQGTEKNSAPKATTTKAGGGVTPATRVHKSLTQAREGEKAKEPGHVEPDGGIEVSPKLAATSHEDARDAGANRREAPLQIPQA